MSPDLPFAEAVVAALDGDDDLGVIETALDEAVRRRAHLVLLDLTPGGAGDEGPAPRRAARALGHDVTAEHWPDVRVEVAHRAGGRATALAQAGIGARLLVVPPSVAPELTARPGCPVLVTRAPDLGRAQRLVVAVVQGRRSDPEVVVHAAEEARARGCPLRVVHAYQLLPGETAGAAADHARRHVLDLLPLYQVVPRLTVTAECTVGEPFDVLPAHAGDAELVTVDGDDASASLRRALAQPPTEMLLVRRQVLAADVRVPHPRGAARAARAQGPLETIGTPAW